MGYSRTEPMNHFTNKEGFNAIRSQVDWTFVARQPAAAHNPVGAYFTTYEKDEPELSVRIFVPREKLAYVFTFEDVGDLSVLPGGRGRNKRIFFSPRDYVVGKTRQQFEGATGL